jgi:cyanophycin synthetase
MQVVETRMLEGPNIFLLSPAVKIEFDVTGDGLTEAQAIDRILRCAELVKAIHDRVGLRRTNVAVEALETPGHIALIYGWERRAFALCIAAMVEQSLCADDENLESAVQQCSELLRIEATDDDSPALVRDMDRRPLTIAVTGTNGKTTTTRLVSHIFATAGKRVGWSSSSGVYIGGEEVLRGDYSGPLGARRVLEDPGVEIAVIETARGGILLKGIACESFDVSIFTNISADHLDLQGIRTVEGLARTKAVVVKITRPGGYAVLNADDRLVMASTQDVVAKKILVSTHPDQPEVANHIGSGGLAIVSDGFEIVLMNGAERIPIETIAEIPMTYQGRAQFMVANALFGAAGAYAGGASIEQIRKGLLTFENTTQLNPGRLNVFDKSGVTVIVDFAHNEAGLQGLLDFAHTLRAGNARLISVIGSAGDRTDISLKELGRIAATQSDHVIAKGTDHYLRGRTIEELMALYIAGIEEAASAPYSVAESELAGVRQALEMAVPGDVIAAMAHEEVAQIHDYLQSIGARPK